MFCYALSIMNALCDLLEVLECVFQMYLDTGNRVKFWR